MLGIFLLSSCQSETGDQQGNTFSTLTRGDTAPEYTVTTTAGVSTTTYQDGVVTLLNLWAPWCGPCREEFPDLEQIHRQFEDEGLRVLAVDIDPDPLETAINFAADFDLSFTVAVDPDGKIMQIYRAVGVPSSFLIAPDGELLYSWSGILKSDAADTIGVILSRGV